MRDIIYNFRECFSQDHYNLFTNIYIYIYIYIYIFNEHCCLFQHLSLCRDVSIHAAGLVVSPVVICWYTQSRCDRLHPQ